MRKTKSPRVVVVMGQWKDRPEIKQLEAEGHLVFETQRVRLLDGTIVEPDLILHEAAHRWDDANWEANLWPAVKARLRAK